MGGIIPEDPKHYDASGEGSTGGSSSGSGNGGSDIIVNGFPCPSKCVNGTNFNCILTCVNGVLEPAVVAPSGEVYCLKGKHLEAFRKAFIPCPCGCGQPATEMETKP